MNPEMARDMPAKSAVRDLGMRNSNKIWRSISEGLKGEIKPGMKKIPMMNRKINPLKIKNIRLLNDKSVCIQNNGFYMAFRGVEP